MRWMFEAKLEIEHAAAARRDDLAEGLADDALGAREAGPLGVRRVAEQQVDAAVAELGELADVGAQPVDRRVVELPVAGVEDAAGRGLDREADGVGDRVRHADELDAERAEVDRAGLGSASRSSAARSRPCSSSFDLTRPSVSRVAQISRTRTSRSRYGSAPTWSSCACVRTTARTGRSRR